MIYRIVFFCHSVKRYLGPVQLHFIKDSIGNREGSGSPDSFFASLIFEANSVAKAHVTALGGNALLCHR